MQVQQLMNQPIITCSVDESANTAATLMWEHDCGAIPLVDGEGRLCGMVTDRDLCMAAYTQGRCLSDIAVRSVMSGKVFQCGANDDIEAAEKLMSKNQIRRVPVVDQAGRPIGMLSINDLARHTGTDKTDSYSRGFLQTLASVSASRHQALATAPAASSPVAVSASA